MIYYPMKLIKYVCRSYIHVVLCCTMSQRHFNLFKRCLSLFSLQSIIPLHSASSKYHTQIINHEGVACLELCNITRSDSAEYTCTARNRHGCVSTTCDLRVKGEEDHKPTPPTFTTSLRGDTHTLAYSCVKTEKFSSLVNVGVQQNPSLVFT